MPSIDWFSVACDRIGWNRRPRKCRNTRRASARHSFLEPLEPRVLLVSDFGDAPDLIAGTGPVDYNTRAADNGPNHTIVAGLRMGMSVDADGGTLQNAAANADDIDQAAPDDEDGLTNPAADLALTIGAQPPVNVIVTNTTGSAATLWGWIDYNNDGLFDNATERAQTPVVNGTNDGIVTLTFPQLPAGFTGTTYARFRLSTDAAGADPTGAASDGEVEDYSARITAAGVGAATRTTKIASGLGGGPTLADFDLFGSSVAALGDLDGDGVSDLAVGAYEDDTGGSGRGALHVLLMNPNGTVKGLQKIAHQTGGGPSLADGDSFGISATSLGDLDGDGVTDLAVGASADDTGGSSRGAVHVLLMNTDGTVKSSQKIAHQTGGGPSLASGDLFGSSLSSLGDVDGDGVGDLAAGALGDGTPGGSQRGAVYVLLMNTDGTVKSSQKIAHQLGGGPTLASTDYFGTSLSSLGDLDGDGVSDLAVGTRGDSTGGSFRGAVHVLLMNGDGTAKSSQKIAHQTGGGPDLADADRFGRSVSALGDLDGDGVRDLAVGAYGDDTGGNLRGAVHVLLLNSSGTVKSSQKIAEQINGGPALADGDFFGRSLSALGDLDGDGVTDLAVGALGDDTGGVYRGAVHVLFMRASVPTVTDDGINGLGNSNRSRVASVVLQFDQAVTVNGVTSLEIRNQTSNLAVDLSTATLTGNGTTTLTWDVSNLSFVDGFYTAKLPRTEAVNAQGTSLAATHSLLFHVLAGDSSGNARVDFADFGELANNFNTINGPVLGPGDMNGDRNVDFGDFGILANNFNRLLTAPSLDFGDAPEAGTSFPTTLPTGARHVLGSGLFLGTSVDGEPNGQPNGTASGDGADEDGVTFAALQAGTSAAVTVTATVPATAVLNAWIDFNADGDWDDLGEQVFVDQALSNGTTSLTVAVPSTATPGPAFARFRVSSCAGHSYFGLATDGEVEDYQVTLLAATSSNSQRRFSPGLFELVASPSIDGLRNQQRPAASTQREFGPPVWTRVAPAATETVRSLPWTEETVESVSGRHAILDEDLVDQVFDEGFPDETDLLW